MNESQKSGATGHDATQENVRLRGDLLTIARRISHDLRTPLGGIIASTEVLKEILWEKNPASVSLVTPIFDSADGMAKLVDRVSFVVKASLNPTPKQPLKMEDMIFRTLQRLESKILKKGASVVEPASWPEVKGVATWLEVIWWNLLSNALDHAKDRIKLDWQEGRNDFRFWVCDDGAGVAVEKRHKLFQPFHFLHEPDASQGLGLSIVERLVELQGGRCGYEPQADGALGFYFTLPI